jgi:hypothetical protein
MSTPEHFDPYNEQLITRQNVAMEQFLTDVRRQPFLSDDSFVLEEELWRIGNYMQYALEGFARLRPDLAKFTLLDESSDTFEDQIRHGREAYESWMISQTLPTEAVSSLELNTFQESTVQTTVSINAYAPGDIEFDQKLPDSNLPLPGGYGLGYISLRNTANLSVHSPEHDQLMHAAALHTTIGTSLEYNAFSTNPEYDGAAIEIAHLMGSGAKEIMRDYGRIGLYRFALWRHMAIVAGSL